MNRTASEEMLAQERGVLAYVQKAIGSLGYETRLFAPGESSSALTNHLLLVGVERDDKGRDRTLMLSFLPFPAEDDFAYLSLLQWYAPLPFVVPAEHRLAVERLLTTINARTSVGYFGLAADGRPFFRYVLATSKWARVEVETIQQLLLVFTHMQDRFGPTIEAVAEARTAYRSIHE
jgi:hypothetical protein